MNLLLLWWNAQQAQEQGAEAKRTDVDWKKKNWPPLLYIAHIDPEDLKEPEKKSFLTMAKLAFFTALIFYIVLGWAHVYLFLKDPGGFVDTCIALLHVIAGIGLTFFILFRGFYGAALGKPCWLIYKMANALWVVLTFYLMFTSRLGIHGIKFVFEEAKIQKTDLVIIYFGVAEIFFCIVTCGIRVINLSDVQNNLQDM